MLFKINKGIIENKFFRVITIIFVVVLMFLISKGDACASSSTKVHIVSVKQATNAILIESDGHFGMVDSGEDNFYPPNPRPGVTIGRGVEEQVKEYLRSLGVNSSNFDFYIGTHAHSDHIGSADQIIREFKPKVVYIPEYKDEYIIPSKGVPDEDYLIYSDGDLSIFGENHKGIPKDIYNGLWDNQFVYDRMVKAAKEVGAMLYTRFNSDIDHFDFGKAKIQLFNTEQDYIRTGVPNANEMSLGVRVTSENGVSAFIGGDMTNIAGIEEREKDKIGKVSLMTTNHHGYWGSNSYNFINTLDPEVMVSTNSRVYLFTRPDPNDDIHTSFNTITERLNNGMKIYSTGALNGKIPAAVFQLDEGLSNNIPAPLYDAMIGYGSGTVHKTLKDGKIIDGVKTGVDGNWVEEDGFTRFKFNDGGNAFSQAIYIDGLSYKFNSSGNLFSSWVREDENWIYFGQDGKKAKGWIQRGNRSYYLDDDYHMVTGPQTIDGDNYYFRPSGTMYTGWLKLDGKWYYYETTVKMAKIKWIKDRGKWYYLDKDGIMVTGVVDIDGTKYCFDDKGAMEYGWYLDGNGDWYYARLDGFGAEVGWKTIGGRTYYFDEQGKMVTGRNTIGGKEYFFLDSGALETGWIKDNGSWYYGREDGSIVNSAWEKVNGKWYYFDDYSEMVTGKRTINNKEYFFSNSGAMETGWIKDNGIWYYGEKSGSLVSSSWKKVGGTWYYFDDYYKMVTGTRRINNNQYLFSSSGAMATGWKCENGTWYYFNHKGNGTEGAMAKNQWKKVWSNWYYFGDTGKMASNQMVGNYYVNKSGAWRRDKWIKTSDGRYWFYYKEGGYPKNETTTIYGNKYNFDSKGYMTTGWKYEKGIWYYFNEKGNGTEGAMARSAWKKVNGKWYYFYGNGKMAKNTVINGYRVNSSGAYV